MSSQEPNNPKPPAPLPQDSEEAKQQAPKVEVVTAERARRAQMQVIVSMERRQWQGPLPAPEDLAKFNQVVPDCAERILRMAEKEQAHRIGYERDGLKATTGEAQRGQYLGAFIAGACVLGAIVTALAGVHPAIPAIFLSVPVLGIVRALINPRGNHTQ